MRARRYLPTPVGFTIVLFGLSIIAGGAWTEILHAWSPSLATSQAALMVVVLYAMSRFAARDPGLNWRFAVSTSLYGLSVVSWMVIAVESYPAAPRRALPALLAAVGLIGCLLAAIVVPLIVVAVGTGWLQGILRSRDRLSSVVVDVGLWLLVFAINLITFVGVLAFRPGGVSTVLAILLALLIMPVLSWIVWSFLYVSVLRRWRVEPLPTQLEAVLTELRGRTGVSFRRILCLDDSFGAGRRCEVVTTSAGPTLIVSVAVATSISELELLALLAHEAGHVRMGHVGTRVIAGTAAGLVFAIAGIVLAYVLYSWVRVALVLGLAVAIVLANIRGLYATALVRRQELEADGFAADVAGAEALTSALTKLGFTGPRSAVVHHRWTTHGTWEGRSERLRGQRAADSESSHS